MLFAAATLLLCGGIILSIHLAGDAPPKATPPSVGVGFLVGGLVLAGFASLSLRNVARREELSRLNEAGLFELPPEPREALVRLNARLASHFGLSRYDLPVPSLPEQPTLEYASRVKSPPPRRPWPSTVGDLRDAIFDGLEWARAQSDSQIDPRQAIADALGWPVASVNYLDTRRIAQFFAARDALAHALDRPPGTIRWSDRLASLVPPGRQRFRVWERLRSRAPQVPPVELNPWVENIAILTFLAALIAIAVPIARAMDRNNEATTSENPGVLGQLVGRAFGLILFAAIIAVLMIPVYAVGRRYASRLPKEVDTVGSLAAYMTPSATEREWTRADVEEHVRDLTAAALNRPPGEIDTTTKL